MTTNVELNEELVKEALRLTNFKTEKELIDFALKELIRNCKKRGGRDEREWRLLETYLQYQDYIEPTSNT